MINRAVLILKYTDISLKWINEFDPSGASQNMSLEDANQENNVYLISEEDSESQHRLDAWLKLNYTNLFESELESWCTDEALWPQNRTFKLFSQWFSFNCHTIIIDTVPAPIVDVGDDMDGSY